MLNSINPIRRTRGKILLFFIIWLALAPGLTWAQALEEMQRINQELKALSVQIKACKGNIECKKGVAAEMQRLLVEMDALRREHEAEGRDRLSKLHKRPLPIEVPCQIRVRNKVEHKEFSIDETCSEPQLKNRYIQRYYVFEYETRSEGFFKTVITLPEDFFKTSNDFSNFILQSPAKPFQPDDIKILQASGYFQSPEHDTFFRNCSIEKYSDGVIKQIDNPYQHIKFKIVYPWLGAGKPNIQFYPLQVTVANTGLGHDLSYDPDSFNPGDFDLSKAMPVGAEQLEADPNNFIISPEDMRAAYRAGRFEREFKWRWNLNELGSYSDNTLALTVDFEKEPGRLEVHPAEGFHSSGPDKDGRFLPEDKTYTLMNSGGKPITVLIEKTQPWLDISTTSRTLAPGDKIQVMLSVEKPADDLIAGTYTDDVLFTNKTNGSGNTSRPVTLEVGEIQVWDVKLTGQETDDMGGSDMYMKMNEVWKTVTVDYGIRFDYVLNARIVLKKEDGIWKFSHGQILNATVKYSTNFDPVVFYIKNIRCLDCNDVPAMAGRSISGEMSGNDIRIIWPHVITRIIVTNKLNLKFESKEKSHQGWSENFFQSAEFLDRARAQWIPLENGHHEGIYVNKESYKQRTRLDKRPQISLSYFYYMKRIQ